MKKPPLLKKTKARNENVMNNYEPEGNLISTVRNREYISSISKLEEAQERQIILEAPAILCDHEFNLHVNFPCGVIGIISRDEAEFLKDNEKTKDIAILTKVGKPVCFKITGFSKDCNGNTVANLSRRDAQIECYLNYISGLITGDIIPAKVTHLENFGAFVDIGCGIVSLLSIDCISVSRISHPASRLSVFDNIFVVVKKIDDKGRIYVSGRELLGSWEENVANFSQGQTVRGIVRSIEEYGIFVELTPNLAGLAEYKDEVKPDQTAAVFIKSIIPDKMKVKLIIIDSSDTPPERQPLKYFIDPYSIQHIDSWTYSPKGCKKIIESAFT
jgi:small subunit ribosomal protein S1